MIPKTGNRFPACAKPGQPLVPLFEASAGEGRSDKIMRKHETRMIPKFNRIVPNA